MAKILSYKTINGKRYKLIMKFGKKLEAHEHAREWKEKGYFTRVIKIAPTGWKYALYIRKER